MRRLLVCLALLGFGLLATPAYADGALGIGPATGSDDTPMEITTAGGCPSPATNVIARIYGAGFAKTGENVVGNTPLAVFDKPIVLPLTQTLRDTAAAQSPPVTLHGVYTLVVSCRLPLKAATYTDYVGSVEFTSPHTYRLTTKRAAIAASPRATPDPVGHATRTIAPVAAPSTGDGAAPAAGRHGVDPLVIVLVGLGVLIIAGFGLLPVLSRRRAAAAEAEAEAATRRGAAKGAAGTGPKGVSVRAGSGAATAGATAGAGKAGSSGAAKSGAARRPAVSRRTVNRPAVNRRASSRPESIAAAAAAAAAERAAEAKAAAEAAVAEAAALAVEAEAAAAEAAAAERATASVRSQPARTPAGKRAAASGRAKRTAPPAGGKGANAEPTSRAATRTADPGTAAPGGESAGNGTDRDEPAGTRAGAKRE